MSAKRRFKEEPRFPSGLDETFDEIEQRLQELQALGEDRSWLDAP